jgi:hypothetical protein
MVDARDDETGRTGEGLTDAQRLVDDLIHVPEHTDERSQATRLDRVCAEVRRDEAGAESVDQDTGAAQRDGNGPVGLELFDELSREACRPDLRGTGDQQEARALPCNVDGATKFCIPADEPRLVADPNMPCRCRLLYYPCGVGPAKSTRSATFP